MPRFGRGGCRGRDEFRGVWQEAPDSRELLATPADVRGRRGWRRGRAGWCRWLSCTRPGWGGARSTPGSARAGWCGSIGASMRSGIAADAARLALGGGAGVWRPRPRSAQPQERRRGLGPASFTRAVRRQHPRQRTIDGEDQSPSRRCNRRTSPPSTASPSPPSPAPWSTSPPPSPRTRPSASSTGPSTSASSTRTPSMRSWPARREGRRGSCGRQLIERWPQRSRTSPAPSSRSGSSHSSSMRSCRGPRSTRSSARRGSRLPLARGAADRRDRRRRHPPDAGKPSKRTGAETPSTRCWGSEPSASPGDRWSTSHASWPRP